MLYLSVLKRVLPFFLTFAAGLFIASFFVTIATPSFRFPQRSFKYREMQRLRDENRELKRTNCELRRKLNESPANYFNDEINNDLIVPAFEPNAPAPPPPPPPPARRAPQHFVH